MGDREQVTGNREQAGPGEEGEAREQVETGTERVAEGDGVSPVGPEGGGDELAGVRDLILKAYPDVVAEMVAGDSVDALLASVPAAREAYSRVAATVREQAPAPTTIPTGSGRRPPIDPEGLSPESKIRVGIREQGSGTSR